MGTAAAGVGLRVLGDAAPHGEILGVRVADLDVKEEVLAQSAHAVFTIPHFDRYAAVPVLLDDVELDELEELITESWLTRAPKRVTAAYRASPRRLSSGTEPPDARDDQRLSPSWSTSPDRGAPPEFLGPSRKRAASWAARSAVRFGFALVRASVMAAFMVSALIPLPVASDAIV